MTPGLSPGQHKGQAGTVLCRAGHGTRAIEGVLVCVLVVGVLQDEDRSQAKPWSQTNAGRWSSVPSRLSENWWALSSETGW